MNLNALVYLILKLLTTNGKENKSVGLKSALCNVTVSAPRRAQKSQKKRDSQKSRFSHFFWIPANKTL